MTLSRSMGWGTYIWYQVPDYLDISPPCNLGPRLREYRNSNFNSWLSLDTGSRSRFNRAVTQCVTTELRGVREQNYKPQNYEKWKRPHIWTIVQNLSLDNELVPTWHLQPPASLSKLIWDKISWFSSKKRSSKFWICVPKSKNKTWSI